MPIMIDTSSAQHATVDGTARNVTDSMAATQIYEVSGTTNMYVRQGTSKKITCATQADMASGDTVAIADGRDTAVVYEFRKAGSVTPGNILVDISAAVTAANVAAALVAAIQANQPALTTTDNTDGTLRVLAPSRIMAVTENVAHASFTVADDVVPPSAADGSTLVLIGQTKHVHGARGAQLGVLQVSAAGVATLTRVAER